MINGVPARTNVDNFYVMHGIFNVFTFYNIALSMCKYSNQLLPDVFNIFQTCPWSRINARNTSTQYVYVSNEQLVDKKLQVTAVLALGIMFLILLTKIMQLAHWKHVSKYHSCYQTMINNSRVKSVYKCVHMHMYVHICTTWGTYVDIHVHERKYITLKCSSSVHCWFLIH